MELSIEELRLIADALGTLDLEYGSPAAAALAERIRDVIAGREADSTAHHRL